MVNSESLASAADFARSVALGVLLVWWGAFLAGLGCGENQNLAILPPPIATMAPTNYYLLFLVDDKGRPSNGVFVQLSY